MVVFDLLAATRTFITFFSVWRDIDLGGTDGGWRGDRGDQGEVSTEIQGGNVLIYLSLEISISKY